MADNENLVKGLLGIGQIIQGSALSSAGAETSAGILLQGGELRARGATIAATGARQSAQAVKRATEFNIQIDSINAHRRLQSISRQARRTFSSQTMAAAASGFALTSKSFMQIRNETITGFEQLLLNTKIDAENKLKSRVFESQVKQARLETQARALDFQSQITRITAAQGASEAEFAGKIKQFGAIQQVIQAAPTLLSQAFSGVK